MLVELVDIWSLSDGSDTAGAFPLVPAEISRGEVDQARDGFPGGPEVWRLAWAIRRQTWGDAIVNGLLEVIIRHDAESGEGAATLRFAAAQGGEDVTMVAPGFERSDALYMEYSTGMFQWPEYSLVNLEYEDHDEAEMFEHSFSSTDRVVVSPHARSSGTPWAEVDGSLQAAAASALIGDLKKQMVEYDEVVMDHLDVLVVLAIHPGTAGSVVQDVVDRVPEVAEALRELGRGV